QLAAAASASRTRIGILHFARKPELVICSHRCSQSVTGAVILPSAAELVIIPTGLPRLAGQAIRLVQRLRLASSCFGICGWGRPPVDLLVVSPTSVSGQHDRDRLTRPARAVRAAGVAGWGRAVPGTRATHRPLPVFSRARPGTQAKRPGGSWGQGQRRRPAPREAREGG